MRTIVLSVLLLVSIGCSNRPEQAEPVNPSLPTTYTVQPGDTLAKIARDHYNGDTNRWYHIKQANPDTISREGVTKVGAVLVIPALPVEGGH